MVSRAALATYIQLFRHPGHHHFFIIFSTSFCDDFRSILDPNLDPKSLQNRSRSPFFQCPKLHRTIFKILKDVLDGMQGFGVPRLPEKLPKSIPNRKKSHQKGDRFNDDFRNYFFLVFYRFWAPSWPPFFIQNRSQGGDRVKHHPTFFEFLVLSPPRGTPGTRFE